jgi:hypothetical protein
LHDSSTEKAIFHAALSLSDAAMRADYLRVACQNDEALRQRIESLFTAAEDGGSFMRRQAIDSIALEPEFGRKIDKIVQEALVREPGERAEFLDRETLGPVRLTP